MNNSIDLISPEPPQVQQQLFEELKHMARIEQEILNAQLDILKFSRDPHSRTVKAAQDMEDQASRRQRGAAHG